MSHTQATTAVRSFGSKAQPRKQHGFMTSETSRSGRNSALLEVERTAVQGLLIDAESRYQRAFQEGDQPLQMWWDGYLRALYHVLEMEGQ